MRPAPAPGDRLTERTGGSDRRAEPAQDRLELLTRAMALAHHGLVALLHVAELALEMLALAHHGLVALLHVAELALETLALPKERLVGRSQRHQRALRFLALLNQ